MSRVERHLVFVILIFSYFQVNPQKIDFQKCKSISICEHHFDYSTATMNEKIRKMSDNVVKEFQNKKQAEYL